MMHLSSTELYYKIVASSEDIKRLLHIMFYFYYKILYPEWIQKEYILNIDKILNIIDWAWAIHVIITW